MRPKDVEEVIRQAPFKPFDIHIDGRTISVGHPEQVFLTPDKNIVVVSTEETHLAILDTDRISSITVKPVRRAKKAS